jgi:hypothetical protein
VRDGSNYGLPVSTKFTSNIPGRIPRPLTTIGHTIAVQCKRLGISERLQKDLRREKEAKTCFGRYS